MISLLLAIGILAVDSATCKVEKSELRMVVWNIRAMPEFQRNKFGFVPGRFNEVIKKLRELQSSVDVITLIETFDNPFLAKAIAAMDQLRCTSASHRSIKVKAKIGFIPLQEGELPNSGVIICSKFDMTLPFTHTFTVSDTNADALAPKGVVATHILVPCTNSDKFYPVTVMGTHMQSDDLTSYNILTIGIALNLIPVYTKTKKCDRVKVRALQLQEISSFAEGITDKIPEPAVALLGDLNIPYTVANQKEDLLKFRELCDYRIAKHANGAFKRSFSTSQNNFLKCTKPDEVENELLDYAAVLKSVRGIKTSMHMKQLDVVRYHSETPIPCTIAADGEISAGSINGGFSDLSDHYAVDSTMKIPTEPLGIRVVDTVILSIPVLQNHRDQDVYLRINGHAYLQDDMIGTIQLKRNGNCWDISNSAAQSFRRKMIANQEISIELMVKSEDYSNSFDVSYPYVTNPGHSLVSGLKMKNRGSEIFFWCGPDPPEVTRPSNRGPIDSTPNSNGPTNPINSMTSNDKEGTNIKNALVFVLVLIVALVLTACCIQKLYKRKLPRTASETPKTVASTGSTKSIVAKKRHSSPLNQTDKRNALLPSSRGKVNQAKKSRTLKPASTRTMGNAGHRKN